jgi:acetylornithine deacetylase/succinyl-diaminopimelate desuccinylase-like protein
MSAEEIDAAVAALDDLGIELAGDLHLLSTVEEEDGGVGGTLSALERGYVPDAAIVAEPFDVPNVGIASGGVMYFRVTVEGKSAHAATGHRGVNAMGKAMQVYEAVEEFDRERKARIDFPPAYRAEPDLEGNVTNINLGTIEAGDWPSTVPARAVIEGRVGWPPGESRAEGREQIEDAIAEAATEDDWLADDPPEVEWFGWQAAPTRSTRRATSHGWRCARPSPAARARSPAGTPASTSGSTRSTTTCPRCRSAPTRRRCTVPTSTPRSRRCWSPRRPSPGRPWPTAARLESEPGCRRRPAPPD